MGIFFNGLNDALTHLKSVRLHTDSDDRKYINVADVPQDLSERQQMLLYAAADATVEYGRIFPDSKLFGREEDEATFPVNQLRKKLEDVKSKLQNGWEGPFKDERPNQNKEVFFIAGVSGNGVTRFTLQDVIESIIEDEGYRAVHSRRSEKVMERSQAERMLGEQIRTTGNSQGIAVTRDGLEKLQQELEITIQVLGRSDPPRS